MGKGRFVLDIPTPLPPEMAWNMVMQFAMAEGFEYTTYNGEELLQKGKGWFTAPQFIKATPYPGVVRVEAWLRYAWLPGVYGVERNLDGFYGWALKDILRNRVHKLAAALQQFPVYYTPY